MYRVEIDPTKYFLTPKRTKRYAKNGQGHHELAMDILRDINLLSTYTICTFRGLGRDFSPQEFLLHLGYVMVDENQELREVEENKYQKSQYFIQVHFNSKAIGEEYLRYLQKQYPYEDVEKCVFVDWKEKEREKYYKLKELYPEIFKAVQEQKEYNYNNGEEPEL